jgi:hypothetical protein
LSNNNPTFLEQWTNGGVSKRMGNLSSTFEKADSAYSISSPLVHGQKQVANIIVKPCKLTFTGRNVLMALKFRREIKKIKIKTGATLILA